MISNNKWFTLIELIVSITILSLIMISVFTIFQLSNQLSNKTDISRAMQENIKNIVENISQDIRNNQISWVNSDFTTWDCWFWEWIYSSWTKLCVWNNSYYLAQNKSQSRIRVKDFSDCVYFKQQCVLVKNDWNKIQPLSNSWVDFRKLSFYTTKNWVKKVIISFDLSPSNKKWLNQNLVKSNELFFQTTIAERLYKY